MSAAPTLVEQFAPEALAEAQRHAQWHAAWTDWVRPYRFDWMLRLSWASAATEARAQRDVAHWFERLQRWRKECAAVVGIERGPVGGLLHVHSLLYTGLPGHGPLSALEEAWHAEHVREAWPHGLVHLERYRPWRVKGGADPRRGGAARYITKEPAGVEVLGAWVRYQPRRR